MNLQVKDVGLSQTVELLILSNTINQFQFSDNETNLDNVIVHAISTNSGFLSKSPSGRITLGTGDFVNGFLTLCDQNKKEIMKQFPLELFLREDPVLHIKPKLISIRNSYVDLPLIGSATIPAVAPAGYAMVFTFYYERFDDRKHSVNKLGEIEFLN